MWEAGREGGVLLLCVDGALSLRDRILALHASLALAARAHHAPPDRSQRALGNGGRTRENGGHGYEIDGHWFENVGHGDENGGHAEEGAMRTEAALAVCMGAGRGGEPAIGFCS